MIPIQCPQCGQSGQVSDQMAKRSVVCRACKSKIVVPDPFEFDDAADAADDEPIVPTYSARSKGLVRSRGDSDSGLQGMSAALGTIVGLAAWVMLCAGIDPFGGLGAAVLGTAFSAMGFSGPSSRPIAIAGLIINGIVLILAILFVAGFSVGQGFGTAVRRG